MGSLAIIKKACIGVYFGKKKLNKVWKNFSEKNQEVIKCKDLHYPWVTEVIRCVLESALKTTKKLQNK